MALNVGGNWNNGTNAGPFYLNGNNAPTNANNSNLGSRLLIQTITKYCVVFSTPLGENLAARTRPSKPVMDLKSREVNKKFTSERQNMKHKKKPSKAIPKDEKRQDFPKHPKRAGYIMERLCTRENAMEAIAEINRRRVKKTETEEQRKKNNKIAAWVEATKEERAAELCELARDFHPKPPRTFEQYDPTAGKTRTINEPALWPDQYIHHMIVQALKPVLMRGMDYFCCGSIKKRGPHRARRAIEKWLEKDTKGTKYAAELDIKKYYDTLSPRVVMRYLRRKIKDRAFLNIVWRIIKSGIKIGFYLSQWLANAVLEPLDHFIREKLGVKHYTRYIDNFTLFGPNKKKLHKAIREIMKFLAGMGLRLKENWQVYNTRKRMVDAVGYRYRRGLTLIRKRSLLRLKRQCTRARKRLQAGKWIALIQARGILSRAGQLRHCAGWALYEKHVKPIEKELKDTVRNASRKECLKWSSIRSGSCDTRGGRAVTSA